MTRELDALIEEATVDCYNDHEQITGLFTMIDEHLALPFDTELLGMPVTATKVDLTIEHEIVAICRRDKHKQTIPILDLRLPDPAPDGAEWIEAYRPLAPLTRSARAIAFDHMASRQQVSIDLDADVAAILREHAAQAHLSEGEIVDCAIRAYDLRALLAQIRERSDLDEDQALALARAELKAARAERDAA